MAELGLNIATAGLGRAKPRVSFGWLSQTVKAAQFCEELKI
jgi:hypothetical protein